jgi:glycosyltransferase involved in cell wall biosynthesis
VKVSLLSFDLSGTCVVRAHLLGRMLVEDFDVEIVGPATDGKVWGPLRDDTLVPFRVLTGSTRQQQAAEIDGDVLYALKPRPTSLGLALEAHRQWRRPLLVDVDDWETGFLHDDVRAMLRSGFRHETKWVASTVLDVRSENNLYRTAIASRQVRHADAVTTTSTWLANRYHGTVVAQARDIKHFDPDTVDREAVRRQLGIDPSKVVLLFMGGPRRHKGLGNVLAAMDRLGRSDLLLLVVGGDPQIAARPDVLYVGWQPYSATNQFLGAADMVVLAHDKSPGARGQMPTKLYDAMAMARPVVVTDVSDMAEVAHGSGIVVPPCDLDALTAAIVTLAEDPQLREELGRAGRARCVSSYSDQAVRPTLIEAVNRAIQRHGSGPTGRLSDASVPDSGAA